MRLSITSSKEIDFNEHELIDDLKKLHGIPPYDGPSNYVAGDGYFANSIAKRYGASLEELSKAVNFKDIIQRWENTRRSFR